MLSLFFASPNQFIDFAAIECAVMRNAGGRAADVLTALVVLDSLIPMQSVAVIHHTGAYNLVLLPAMISRVLTNRMWECRLRGDACHGKGYSRAPFGPRARAYRRDLEDEIWDVRSRFVSLLLPFPSKNFTEWNCEAWMLAWSRTCISFIHRLTLEMKWRYAVSCWISSREFCARWRRRLNMRQ